MSNFGSRIIGYFGGTAGGGGGGGINPTNTYMPYNNNGSFADSYWVYEFGKTYTTDAKGGGNVFGLGNNYDTNKTWLGDIELNYAGFTFIVDYLSNEIYTNLGFKKYGFYTAQSGTGFVTAIGDYLEENYNYTWLAVDNTNAGGEKIETSYSGTKNGLLLEFFNNRYLLGNHIDTQTFYEVDALSGLQRTFINGAVNGFNASSTFVNLFQNSTNMGLFINYNNGGQFNINTIDSVGLINGILFDYNDFISSGIVKLYYGNLDKLTLLYIESDGKNCAIKTRVEGVNSLYSEFGLFIDNNSITTIGDYSFIRNSTFIAVKQDDNRLFFSNNLFSATGGDGGLSYIKLKIFNDNNQYYIEHFEPSV